MKRDTFLAKETARVLGAPTPLGSIHMMIFVPSVDRKGRALARSWVRSTLRTLAILFRGATAFPSGLGVWRDDDSGGKLIFDDTTIVFSYVARTDLTVNALRRLRAFLHRMGRETKQGEIGLVVDGCYLGITTFDGWST